MVGRSYEQLTETDRTLTPERLSDMVDRSRT